MKTEDGRLVVIGGASRSGKTAWVRKATRQHKRIMAWDPEDQWAQLPGWRRVTSRAELLAACQQAGPLRVAFVAGGDLADAFDFWARCVFYAGRFVGPLAAIAEELADVTTPSKAPGNWGILLRRGLKRGIWIYAISQRWSEADKTAFGNATDYVVFRLPSADDVRYFARKTRIAEETISGLKPLHFQYLDALTGKTEAGRLSF